MDRFTIKNKNIVIKDEEIYNTIKNGNIEYIKLILNKELNGELCLVAYPPSPAEYTLSRQYQKIAVVSNHITIRTPKYLMPHIGKQAKYYIERLYPTIDELFRIKPIHFLLHDKNIKYSTKKIVRHLPYFDNNDLCVVPQDYLNEYVNHQIVDMSISFAKTSKGVLLEGFIFATLLPGRRKRNDVDIFNLQKYNIGMHLRSSACFIKFVERNGKRVNKYKYISTEKQNGCSYGLIVFKEGLGG